MLFEMSEESYGHWAGVLQKSKAPFHERKKASNIWHKVNFLLHQRTMVPMNCGCRVPNKSSVCQQMVFLACFFFFFNQPLVLFRWSVRWSYETLDEAWQWFFTGFSVNPFKSSVWLPQNTPEIFNKVAGFVHWLEEKSLQLSELVL